MIKILLVKPEDESLLEFTNDLDRWGFDYELMDYPIDSKGLVDDDFKAIFAEKMYQAHGERIDSIMFFSREWTNPPNKRIWGRMFNKAYSGYLLSYTKLRRGYHNTARHELMHKLDNWTRIYLGIHLEDVVGVEDWDDCVVHGEDARFTEISDDYDYDAIFEKVKPYVRQAIGKRKHTALLGYMEQLIIMLRKKIIELQARIYEAQAIQHPLPGSRISQAYGVESSIYKLTGRHIGTDYAVPVGTSIKAPKRGEIVVAGHSASLGYFCHYKYTDKGQVYVARIAHLSQFPLRGVYKRGDIIAVSGDTGMVTGPHCHIDIWPNDVRLDLLTRENWDELTINPEDHFSDN